MAVEVNGRRMLADDGTIKGTSVVSSGAVSGTTAAFSGTATLVKPLVFTPHVIAALAIDTSAGVCWTKTVSADSTLTASSGGTAGQLLILIVTVDATQRVITSGTNLNSAGTLTVPASKVGTLTFISDGTAFREIARAILT